MTKTAAKTAALADHLEAALVAEEPGVTVETRYRRASESFRNRRDQKQVLGDPVYYLEVLPASVSALDPAGPGGEQAFRRRAHDLQAVLLVEYDDADDRAASSQPLFDRLMDALYDAAAEGDLMTEAGPQTMVPGDATVSFTALDSEGEVIAHELTLTVTLTDYH